MKILILVLLFSSSVYAEDKCSFYLSHARDNHVLILKNKYLMIKNKYNKSAVDLYGGKLKRANTQATMASDEFKLAGCGKRLKSIEKELGKEANDKYLEDVNKYTGLLSSLSN